MTLGDTVPFVRIARYINGLVEFDKLDRNLVSLAAWLKLHDREVGCCPGLVKVKFIGIRKRDGRIQTR